MAQVAMPSRFTAVRLLVIFLSIGTTMLQRAGAFTGGSTSLTPFEECGEEQAICDLDAECTECSTTTDVAEVQDCLEGYSEEYNSATTSTCEALSAIACCFDAVSDNDCISNYAFEDLVLCEMSAQLSEAGGGECTTITCNGARRAYGFPLCAALSVALGIVLLVAMPYSGMAM